MSYQVDKFNGTFFVSVEDGTIDTTSDLRFVGKNYAGYGEVQNENFLHLLENFANTTEPPKKVIGQVWYDSANKKLKFYDGNKFKIANGAEVAASPPPGLSVGEFWWDNSAKQLYTYTGTDFVLVGPAASPTLGTSSAVAQVVKDDKTVPDNHTILKLIAGGKTIAIINEGTEFTLGSSNPIANFTKIKKGITLVDTNSNGISQNDYVYWGTAETANALIVNGVRVNADNFLQKDAPEPFTSEINFNDPGFTVGNGNDFKVYVANGDEVYLTNQLGNPITVRITVPGVTEVNHDVAVFSSTGIAPAADASYSLGTLLSRWNRVYADGFSGDLYAADLTVAYDNVTKKFTGAFVGNLVASDSATVMINAVTKEIGYAGATLRGNLFGSLLGNVTGTASNANTLADKSPSITVTSGTAEIPIRDATGNIYANGFKGIADKANQLLVGASYLSTSLAADANTVVARDEFGDITTRYFKGTATAARYADLAEKYLADKEYEPGTVVSVCHHKDHEVEACAAGNRALGVVSTNPAYMMNSELEGGTYIALKGRVPVKVQGPVAKGDELVAGNDGCAVRGESKVFAIALESNDDPGVKVIEAVVL
jgi:hypothetical protein